MSQSPWNKNRINWTILLFLCFMLMGPILSMDAQKKGRATYYADRLHGKRTSNGDVYNRDSFTCAHRSFPFGTILKVKNIQNNKVVFVRVNDRLGRSPAIIDLSYAAAKKIGIIMHGKSFVEITRCNDLFHIPYRQDIEIPQIKVRDPLSKGYCTLAEWGDRYKQLKQRSVGEIQLQLDEDENDETSCEEVTNNDSLNQWEVIKLVEKHLK